MSKLGRIIERPAATSKHQPFHSSTVFLVGLVLAEAFIRDDLTTLILLVCLLLLARSVLGEHNMRLPRLDQIDDVRPRGCLGIQIPTSNECEHSNGDHHE